jgi:hypothetical protein
MKAHSIIISGIILSITIIGACKNKNPVGKYDTIAPKVETNILKDTSHKVQEIMPLFFENKIFYLGSVKKGSTSRFSCVFSNISSENIKLKLVEGSCGCMTFDYNKGYIQPNEKSSINVVFSSGPMTGFFKKEIYVHICTGQIIILTVKVNVI